MQYLNAANDFFHSLSHTMKDDDVARKFIGLHAMQAKLVGQKNKKKATTAAANMYGAGKRNPSTPLRFKNYVDIPPLPGHAKAGAAKIPFSAPAGAAATASPKVPVAFTFGGQGNQGGYYAPAENGSGSLSNFFSLADLHHIFVCLPLP
jgi:hypothetical protein